MCLVNKRMDSVILENHHGWGQVQYLYLSTYLSVLVLEQKVLST